MEKALTRAGIGVRSFEKGEDVLSALVSDQPHAIVSDIKMPGIDGLAMLRRIKSSYADLPIIITLSLIHI